MLGVSLSVFLDAQPIPVHVCSLSFASQSLKRLRDVTHVAQNQGHLVAQTAADIIADMVTWGAPQIFIEVGSKIIIVRGRRPGRNLVRLNRPINTSPAATTNGLSTISGFCITATSEIVATSYALGASPFPSN